MEKLNLKRELLLWILLMVPIIYIAFVWNTLPDKIPVHFGVNGKPNGWSGKWGVFILPATNIFNYLLLLFVPLIDPKWRNYEFFQLNYYKIRFALTLFLGVMCFLPIIAADNGPTYQEPGWVFAFISFFIAMLGNFMINIKPNWFAGIIRSPWTLSSDTVWRKTHQIFGRIWFYGGLLLVVLAFMLPVYWESRVMLVFVLGSAVFGYAYSFWLFKQEE